MTIHTLHARLDPETNLYIYDDAYKGVFCEPLVESTTEAIHQILLSAQFWTDIHNRPPEVTLRFTCIKQCFDALAESPYPIIKLHYRRYANDMSVYGLEGSYPQPFIDEWDFMDDMGGPTEVELCNHLLDYFPAAPESFYCQLSLSAVRDFGLVAA